MYSGATPEFIDGDVFKTKISLNEANRSDGGVNGGVSGGVSGGVKLSEINREVLECIKENGEINMADVKNEKKDIYDYFDLIDQAKTKFFAWLRRSGYTLEYIAERLATTPDDIVLRLRRREKFNERELRILIYLMGAKDAFFVIDFPSFRFRKYVYRCVFGKKMRCRKRRRWKKK